MGAFRLTMVSIVGALALPVSAHAGEVKIVDTSDEYYDFAVKVKDDVIAPTTPLEKDVTGAFLYNFDSTTFADLAYATRIFVLTWTPKGADKPAIGAKQYSIEIPVLLRSWLADAKYEIDAWAFDGIGNAKLGELENLRNSEDLWRKFFAALGMADHYARRVSPSSGLTQRALNISIDALVHIATDAPGHWLLSPFGLDDVVGKSFADDTSKQASLRLALLNVDSLIWKDLPAFEANIGSASCAFVQATFDYLDNRRSEDEKAFRLQVAAESKLFEEKRKIVESRACGTS